MTFPSTLDSFSNPAPTDSRSTAPTLSTRIGQLNDAIESLETKVGIDSSSDVTSIDYKLANKAPLTTKGDILAYSTLNTRLWVWSDGDMLVSDSSETTWLKWIPATSWGTVTDVSVVSANWFAWTVANDTTSPDVTITTTINGIIKGNGTSISAASAGTDYLTPTWSGSGLTWVLPAGMISPYAWSYAPTGWLLSDGSQVSRATYSALFSAIGTTYWSGDWSTTFHLPDLRGKVTVGKNAFDTEFDTLGETWGEKTHTLTVAEMPTHSHWVLSSVGGWANSWAVALDSGLQITWTYATTSSNWYNIIESKWSGTAHNNLQPYIVLQYIIKT